MRKKTAYTERMAVPIDPATTSILTAKPPVANFVLLDNDPVIPDLIANLLEHQLEERIAFQSSGVVELLDEGTELFICENELARYNDYAICRYISQHFPTIPIIFYCQENGRLDPHTLWNDLHPFALIYKNAPTHQLLQAIHHARSLWQERQENRKLLRRLAQWNEELEAKVQEHTKDLRSALARNQALIATDPLTELANRRYFFQIYHRALHQAERYKRPLTLLMVDVDHFKICNDTYGHLFGDKVLCHLAALMQGQLRQVDLIGRIGGDEFAVLLPDTDLKGAKLCAERIRAAVASTTELQLPDPPYETFHITLSIGGATRTGSQKVDANALFQAADKALYESKRAGRDRSFCLSYRQALTYISPTPAIKAQRQNPSKR